MLRRGNLLVRGASGERRYFYFTNVVSTAMHYGRYIQVFEVVEDVPCVYIQHDNRPSFSAEDDNAYYTQVRQHYGLDETVPILSVRRGNGMADELQVFGMPKWLKLLVTVDSKSASVNNVVEEVSLKIRGFRPEWRWIVKGVEDDLLEEEVDDEEGSGCIVS